MTALSEAAAPATPRPNSAAALSSWRLAWTLARRELRGGLKGFRILIACLALGVAAIAAVQSVSGGIMAGLEADGRALLGGDVSTRQLFRPYDDDQLAYLKGSGRVGISAEMRAMARPADGSDSLLVELKAVDGAYPLFGAMTLEDAIPFDGALTKRDGVWGAVAEPAVLERLGLKIGDTLAVGEAKFTLRGVIAREPDRIGSGSFSLGPRLMIALDALADTHLTLPGALVYWNAKLALSPGTDVAEWVKATEASPLASSWRIRDFSNASPRVSRFIDRLSQFLTLVGLTALLVGGVGVSNAVRAHLDSRAGTIATLKCLGAPGALVVRVYLLQVMTLAGLGIALGLVLGALLPLVAEVLLADLLPVSAQFGVGFGTLAPAALFGLLTALAFSLWPLGRVPEVAPAALFRDTIAPAGGRPGKGFIAATAATGLALAALAILGADNRFFATWFVVGALVTFALFRLAAWAAERLAERAPRSRFPTIRLAVANLHRPGNATAAVTLSLGLGLTVLVTIALVEGNFTRRVTEALPDTAPTHFMIDIQPGQYDAFADTLRSMDGVNDFQAVPSLRGRIVTINGAAAETKLIDPSHDWVLNGDRGVSYAAERPSDAPIIAGEWWAPDYRGKPLLSVDDDIAMAFGVGPGDRVGVNVMGRVIEGEIANVRHIDFSTMALNFILVFSPGVLEAAPHTWVAAARVDDGVESGFRRAILQSWPNVSTIRLKDALATAAQILGDVGVAVRVVAAVALVAGALVLAGAIAAGHQRRVRDAVILKVLGAERRTVTLAFLLEYGMLGLAVALAAGAIGTAAAWAVLTQVMGFEWSFLPGSVITTTILALFITLALGYAGTWRALGAPAAPLLRNE